MPECRPFDHLSTRELVDALRHVFRDGAERHELEEDAPLILWAVSHREDVEVRLTRQGVPALDVRWLQKAPLDFIREIGPDVSDVLVTWAGEPEYHAIR